MDVKALLGGLLSAADAAKSLIPFGGIGVALAGAVLDQIGVAKRDHNLDGSDETELDRKSDELRAAVNAHADRVKDKLGDD